MLSRLFLTPTFFSTRDSEVSALVELNTRERL